MGLRQAQTIGLCAIDLGPGPVRMVLRWGNRGTGMVEVLRNRQGFFVRQWLWPANFISQLGLGVPPLFNFQRHNLLLRHHDVEGIQKGLLRGSAWLVAGKRVLKTLWRYTGIVEAKKRIPDIEESGRRGRTYACNKYRYMYIYLKYFGSLSKLASQRRSAIWFLFPLLHSVLTHSGTSNSHLFDLGFTIRIMRAFAARRSFNCREPIFKKENANKQTYNLYRFGNFFCKLQTFNIEPSCPSWVFVLPLVLFVSLAPLP